MVEWVLVFVAHTHMWIDGSNTFVKVCTYKEKTEIHRHTAPKRKYWEYPDYACPNKIFIRK